MVKARHAQTAFSGEGVRLAGGRWNLPGDRAIYASSSLALAAMETFVHFGEDGLHIRFVYFRIKIPDTVPVRRCPRPPQGWQTEPPGEASMRFGSAWLRSGRGAVLQVPSAIIPTEWNFVFNPVHPDFAKLRIGRPRPFSFDSRMWT
ncbi:MAG: RES family NAD+ phosphorylase [Elioraea sp.]|nr:RES family NAD+ phosphorylase [Elioraea sp.]